MKNKYPILWASASVVIVALLVVAFVLPGIAQSVKKEVKPLPLDLKHVLGSPTLITGELFEIFLTCDRNFEIRAIYADVDDPDNAIDVFYQNVTVNGNFDGTSSKTFHVRFVPFDPLGIPNLLGHELLSQMQIIHPLDLPAGGSLRILGFVEASADPANDQLSAGAVVETAQDAVCALTILG